MNKKDTLAFLAMGEAMLKLADHISDLTKVFSARFSLLERLSALRAKLEQKKDGPERDRVADQLREIAIQSASELSQADQQLRDAVARSESIRDQSSAFLAHLRTHLEGMESDASS
jgi:hypothetical protein